MTQATVSPQANADFAPPVDRGGGDAPNGKPSLTVDEAAQQILRDGHSLNAPGVTGTAAVVTYAYRDTSGPMPRDTDGFAHFSATQINATEQALAGWSDVANVTFVRVGSGTGANAFSDNATLLFGNYTTGNAGAAATTFYPGDTSAGSSDDDIWVNKSLSYMASPAAGNYGQLALTHEIGHAIGLGEAEDLDPGYGSPSYAVNAGYYEDSQQYTLMSDWAASNTGADYGGLYASAPMMDDIAAAQALYGANMSTRATDTVYGFNSTAGRSWFSAASATSPLIFSVWDAGGNDTFDFSGYSQNAFIDLRATHFSSVGGMIGNVSIAQGVTIENAIGGTGDDIFVGNSADNHFDGGAGIDTVDYSTETANITASLATGDVTGTGIGHDTLANIENITTGNGIDTVSGNAAANIIATGARADFLYGLGGNDVLDGGAGNDTMYGGAGDDTYYVDTAGDVVSEQTTAGVDDGGNDTVVSQVTWTLGDGFENLTLGSTRNINGTGNALNNIITGNSGSNVLNGGDGNDTIYGGDSSIGTIIDSGGAYHGSLATAMAISSAAFSLNADVNIADSTTAAHATVQGGGDNTYRFYSFTINAVGAVGTFDIDQTVGMDSVLRLYDATGNLLATDDDSLLSDGAGGSTSGSDAFLQYLFTKGGTYYIEVAEYSHDPVAAGDSYVLNLSLANNGATIGGNDYIDGGAGADAMFGGLGNDTYIVDNAGDQVTEGFNEGVDQVMSSVSFVLGADVDNLTLTGSGNLNATGNAIANVLVGTAGNNVIIGNGGDDTIFAGAGNDAIDGGSGSDTVDYASDTKGITVSFANASAVGAGIGTDSVVNVENINSGSGADTLSGNDSANIFHAGAGNDSLTTFGGNDVLDGGAGADTLFGGSGNDTYYVDNVNDKASEQTVAGVDDGGVDTVYTSVTWTLGAGFENAIASTTAAIGLTGNDLNNQITGGAGSNVLTGLGGNDIIIAGGGTDALDGGTGVDQMWGGSGNDTYYVDSVNDKVSEQTVAGVDDGGDDTVVSSVGWTLGDFFERLVLTGTANINGTANVNESCRLTGNDGNNTLTGGFGWDTLVGNGGNDILIGGEGQDTMIGGAGNDTYYVDDEGDKTSEVANGGDAGGNDRVFATASTTIGAYIETLTLSGLGSIDGTGNAQANTINGNSGNNVLKGMDGADLLIANAGNDTLDGGTGADRMLGGAGNDTYVVDNSGDRVVEQTVTGVDDGGTDTVQSSISFQLGQFFENLTLTGSAAINATGNELNNVLTGNTGDNTLNGGLGADTMSGGKGNDTYFVDNIGDVVTENANEGTKDKVISSIAYALTANVENLTVTGTGNFTVTGNALGNILVGNSGNNLIDAGAGADHMFGGAGDDTYIVDNDGDRVSEQLSGSADDGGKDTVMASVTYHIFSFVENLTLTGTADINGTGNAFDNVMIGNSGNNVLNGGAGADTMSGGLGNDGYIVDSAGDVVIENAGEGTDKVSASISYALTANVENLALTGSANINAAGNELDNVITGNAGNNRIDGGAGADRLFGGAGNDTYVVDNINDKVSEALSGHDDGGTDLVQSSVSFTLGNFIENLTLTGLDAVSGTGNSLANTLIGNNGANTLNGGGGHDVLTGNGGADIFLFGLASGADTITDFSAGQNDSIDASAYHAVAHTVTQSGADTVIDFGGGNVITVQNATTADVLAHTVF